MGMKSTAWTSLVLGTLVSRSLHHCCKPEMYHILSLVKFQKVHMLNYFEGLENFEVKNKSRQDSIPVKCVLPACQPYVFWWPPLDVSTSEERLILK